MFGWSGCCTLPLWCTNDAKNTDGQQSHVVSCYTGIRITRNSWKRITHVVIWENTAKLKIEIIDVCMKNAVKATTCPPKSIYTTHMGKIMSSPFITYPLNAYVSITPIRNCIGTIFLENETHDSHRLQNVRWIMCVSAHSTMLADYILIMKHQWHASVYSRRTKKKCDDKQSIKSFMVHKFLLTRQYWTFYRCSSEILVNI